MFAYVANAVEIKNSIAPQSVTTSSTPINGSAVDLAAYDGAALLRVYSSQLGAGSGVWSVEESETGTGSWTAVAAAALVNPATGVAATFTAAGTSAIVNETLALKKEVLKRFVRAVMTPTGATGSFVADVVGFKRNY